MNSPERRHVLVILLILSVAFSIQWSLHSMWGAYPERNSADRSALFLEALPRKIREFLADICWLKAEEYMHFGPSCKINANFTSGSYAGNTDIIPLLEFTLRLDPRHIDACMILAHNLALHLNRFTEGIRLLQSCILANPGHKRLHELYATCAYLYGFRKSYIPNMPNDRQIALKYIDKALALYKNEGDAPIDPTMTPQTYSVWKARFLVELGRSREALAVWKQAQLPLNEQGGLLGEYLRRLEAGLPIATSPEESPNVFSEAQASKNIDSNKNTSYRQNDLELECLHNDEQCEVFGCKPVQAKNDGLFLIQLAFLTLCTIVINIYIKL